MQETRQKIAQAFPGTSKGELCPGNRNWIEFSRFETLVVCSERTADGGRRVHEMTGVLPAYE